MNMILKLSLGLGVFLIGALQCHAQEPATLPHAPIVPAELQAVLASLPAPPANWKLTESLAHNNFADWQSTTASRKYLEVPPPPLPGQPPKVPGKTWLVISDTGYWPGDNSAFLDPKWGMWPNQERSSVGSYPAILIHPETKDGDENLLVWVKQRFIVSVTTSNQEKKAGLQWAQMVNFAALVQISDDGPKTLPNPLPMGTLDELIPARTGHGYLFWHRSAR